MQPLKGVIRVYTTSPLRVQPCLEQTERLSLPEEEAWVVGVVRHQDGKLPKAEMTERATPKCECKMLLHLGVPAGKNSNDAKTSEWLKSSKF